MARMTAERAAFILECHNRWRRGDDDYAETNPKVLGEAIDFAIQALSAPRVPDAFDMPEFSTINRSSLNYKAGWNACRRAMLAASPEPVAPDAQQVIADLRAEVAALKDWQRKHRHAAELDTVDMVCMREALNKIQRIADGYVSTGELPVMVVIQTICRQALLREGGGE